MKAASQRQKTEDSEDVLAWNEGLIGHAAVHNVLTRALDSGRLAHAYLFVGPEGTGKGTVARRFASMLLGVSVPETHPDFTFVERERDAKTGKPHNAILLEQVQALTARLSLAPMMGGWRVAILDGAQLLNKESANALLKTLEEPHEKTMLLLTATSAEEVMATIRSRCQLLRFTRVATVEIIAALRARGVDHDQAELYARLADGRPGVAVSFTEKRSVRLDDMFAMRDAILSMPASAVADRFMAIEKAIPPKLPFQDAVDRARDWLDLAAELLRDAMLIKLGAEERVVHVDARERVASWARQCDPVSVLAVIEESRKLLNANVSPRAALERVAASF
jgi:DNA polymerase-3 subunit delta'